jgi:CMP-N-acetylneuraminic acid synthetase
MSERNSVMTRENDKRIVALLLGREGSVGFPNKNIYPIMGRPMMVYPMLAASKCKYVSDVFLSTDSERMKEIALSHGVKVIDRPPELCTAEALSEDAWVHGYRYIRDELKIDIEMLVLLFCNAPTINADQIAEGVDLLRKDKTLDSAATVSVYNTFSPVRARKLREDGTLCPLVPLEVFEKSGKVDSDRGGLGDVLFADCSAYSAAALSRKH